METSIGRLVWMSHHIISLQYVRYLRGPAPHTSPCSACFSMSVSKSWFCQRQCLELTHFDWRVVCPLRADMALEQLLQTVYGVFAGLVVSCVLAWHKKSKSCPPSRLASADQQ